MSPSDHNMGEVGKITKGDMLLLGRKGRGDGFQRWIPHVTPTPAAVRDHDLIRCLGSGSLVQLKERV